MPEVFVEAFLVAAAVSEADLSAGVVDTDLGTRLSFSAFSVASATAFNARSICVNECDHDLLSSIIILTRQDGIV